jgi:hypothetical protein
MQQISPAFTMFEFRRYIALRVQQLIDRAVMVLSSRQCQADAIHLCHDFLERKMPISPRKQNKK